MAVSSPVPPLPSITLTCLSGWDMAQAFLLAPHTHQESFNALWCFYNTQQQPLHAIGLGSILLIFLLKCLSISSVDQFYIGCLCTNSFYLIISQCRDESFCRRIHTFSPSTVFCSIVLILVDLRSPYLSPFLAPTYPCCQFLQSKANE